MAERVLEQAQLYPYKLMISKRDCTLAGVLFGNQPTPKGRGPKISICIKKVGRNELQKHSGYKFYIHLSPGADPLSDTAESQCSTSE
jgi:hypothetical protein